MEIKNINQYNQGIGKYKVLSSNAGVGSIVATKWGGFIMPTSSSKWGFVKAVTEYIKNNSSVIPDSTKIFNETGVEIIEDNRFIGFLKKTEGLNNLKCLVAIPHVSLNMNNYCEINEHPTNIRYRELHPSSNGLNEGVFTVPAIVFPRWFYSRKTSILMPLERWIHEWKAKNCNGGELKYFAPPRDPSIITNRKIGDPKLPDGKNKIHGLLEQISMVLICPNGHISDIPWDKYFSAKLEKGKLVTEEGFDLFHYEGDPCPNSNTGEHELQWLENRSHSESFGTLHCKCCNKKVSLEGIMNLQPLCPGERPWEGLGSKDHFACIKQTTHERTTMKWAMVTSNSVYYAENFSSLFIPDCYRKNDDYLDDKQQKVLTLMKDKWYAKYAEKHPGSSFQDYIDNTSIETLIDKADDSDYSISKDEMEKIVKVFLGVDDEQNVGDVREEYRFSEFEVFQNNTKSSEDNDKLSFNDIELPITLKPYFHKIQQVNTLGMSTTQINFSRVSMPQPIMQDDGTIEYPNRMKIFQEAPDDVIAMPANQSFGEGLFFSFNNNSIEKWYLEYASEFSKHYASIEKHDETYNHIYQEMKSGGISKFMLLHTFSHIMMKELEFSCGYPTASLSERLYFSDRMCGVLIYTTDGAEGSMGGLVWQGQPELIEKIIKQAVQRALNCASDPICWENEDQLNYAACFSCAMVSETSCEKRNVGLDRRILVDERFGFFKNLI